MHYCILCLSTFRKSKIPLFKNRELWKFALAFARLSSFQLTVYEYPGLGCFPLLNLSVPDFITANSKKLCDFFYNWIYFVNKFMVPVLTWINWTNIPAVMWSLVNTSVESLVWFVLTAITLTVSIVTTIAICIATTCTENRNTEETFLFVFRNNKCRYSPQ